MKTLEAIPEPEFSSDLDPVKEGPERRSAIKATRSAMITLSGAMIIATSG
jgi:hypothetical protein